MAVCWPDFVRGFKRQCSAAGQTLKNLAWPSDYCDSDGPRPSAWRRAARAARPVLITVISALAFLALLRIHHAKFKDSMVRSFQKQQLRSVSGLATSVEEEFRALRRDLLSIVSHPDVRGLAPAAKDVLASCLQGRSAVLEELAVLDAAGKQVVVVRSPSAEVGNDGDEAPEFAPAAGAGQRRLTIWLPILREGQAVGALYATINIYHLAVGCQAQGGNTAKSVYWLLTDSDVIVHDESNLKGRCVQYVLSDSDAPRQKIPHVDLWPYALGRCVAGHSGLADVTRADGEEELIAFAPITLDGRRFGVAIGSPQADVAVPIDSHERVTYALILALALLYFATGYTACRSERAHTELEHQRRKAAEHASKAKGDFLAQMSHELRTPLNGVIAMTELAASAATPAEQQSYLNVVRESADSLLAVVNDVLDLSKVEIGRMDLCNIPMHVPACVIHALTSLAPLARTKGLALRWEISPEVPAVVLGDPGRLRQVLNNLIGNALKFTTTGEVVVRASIAMLKQQRVLHFEVQDTGRGMSAQDIARIFDPYYQCSAADGSRPDSTGLGLAIAQRVVGLMGGEIHVRSEEGHGTAFAFDIRLNPAAAAALPTKGEMLPKLAGRTVLVVCPAQDRLGRLAQRVSSWVGSCSRIETAQAALLAVKTARDSGKPFTLVVYDSGGVLMSPFAFADELAVVAGSYLPLVAMCPEGLSNDATQCIQTGIDVYLGQDVDDDQLHLALRLAVAQAAKREACAGSGTRSARNTPSLNVLVVDDNPVNRQATSILLQRWGHRAKSAASGEEALWAMEAERFDLVLMDYEMPGLSGVETTIEIRRREMRSGHRVPIVAMTAHAQESDCERCLRAGMDRYISKPFRPDHLRDLIADMFADSCGRPVSNGPLAATPTAAAALEWDRDEALALAGGDAGALGAIIDTFLADLREVLPQADAAAAVCDAAGLAALAHRWKGSLGLLGAPAACRCAEELQQACTRGDAGDVGEHFRSLRRCLVSLQTTLTHEREATACASS